MISHIDVKVVHHFAQFIRFQIADHVDEHCLVFLQGHDCDSFHVFSSEFHENPDLFIVRIDRHHGLPALLVEIRGNILDIGHRVFGH